ATVDCRLWTVGQTARLRRIHSLDFFSSSYLQPTAHSPRPRRMSAVAKHAATVLLLREAGAAVEVLRVRRHQNLAFMGGMGVFPGGGLSSVDYSARALERIPAAQRETARPLLDLAGKPLAATESLGLYVAACRETFEEAGLLLAMDAK